MAATLRRDVIDRAMRGEHEAYEHLAREAAERLYPVARRILRDGDLADEALQRTLVTIWRGLPRLRDVERYEAWSYRVLVRFCGDEQRRQRRLAAASVSPELLGGDGDGSAGISDRDQLERAFRRLSSEQRAVVVMTYYRGLSGAQVGDLLGISPGTVASRLHYALRNLRAAIDADSRPPFPAGSLPLPALAPPVASATR
jgi:RNA polymerase sigma factor (sigma-70 family)